MNSPATPVAPAKWDDIPHIPLGSAPDSLPEEQPLLYRQIVAKRALIAGYEETEETAQTISDALTDLHHLCDALGLDFATLDQSAYRSYIEEREASKTKPV